MPTRPDAADHARGGTAGSSRALDLQQSSNTCVQLTTTFAGHVECIAPAPAVARDAETVPSHTAAKALHQHLAW